MRASMKKRLCILMLLCSLAAWGQNPLPPQPEPDAVTLGVQLIQPPQSVGQPTIQQTGGGGPTGITFYYFVVPHFLIGRGSPSPAVQANNVPVTLDSGHYFTIYWQAVAGATGYDVLRGTSPQTPAGACNCAVTLNTSALSVNDQSNSLSSYTVTTFDANQVHLYVDNEAQSAGVSHLILRQGPADTFVCDLSIGCGGGGGSPGAPNFSVQFNDGGVFTGNAALTFNPATPVFEFNNTATGEFVVQALVVGIGGVNTTEVVSNSGGTTIIGGTGVGGTGGGKLSEIDDLICLGDLEMLNCPNLTNPGAGGATVATIYLGGPVNFVSTGGAVAVLGMKTGEATPTLGLTTAGSAFFIGATVVASLPAAAAGNSGYLQTVSDSTSVAAEGQTCVGGSTHTAIAISDGTQWKCF